MKARKIHLAALTYMDIAYFLIWVSIALLMVLTLLNHIGFVEATQHAILFKGVRLLLIGSIITTIWQRHKALSAIGVLMMVVVTIQ